MRQLIRPVRLERLRRSWRATALMSLVLASWMATATSSEAVSSSTVTVSSSVLSSTILTTTGCTGAAINLGSLAVNSTSITASDCTVTFGSSNDTSRMRLWQADRSSTAMTQLAPATTTLQGAPRFDGAAAKSATEGWLVGNTYKPSDPVPISYTSNGGATWSAQTSCDATSRLYDVEYVGASTVVAVGTGGIICRSTTSGIPNWGAPVASPSTSTWYAATSFGGSSVWLGGNAGRIGYSSDGGATWALLAGLPSQYRLQSLDAASATNIYGTAQDGATPRGLYAIASTDAGVTWSITLIGNTQATWTAKATAALSATSAIVASSYGKLRTTDSGATWSLVDASAASCLMNFDGTTIIGFNAAGTSPRRSVNGGTTWSSITAPPSGSGSIFACEAGSSTTGFYGGENDQRATVTASGSTISVAPTSYNDQRGISAWSTDSWVSVGDGGSIRRSVDGGATITNPASGTAITLFAVETAHPSLAVVVGNGGTIIRSTDKGVTWASATSGTAATLRSIDRSPDGWLFAVGDAGTVLRSSDDGVTWTPLSAPSALTVRDVVALGRDTAWVVGDTGSIYRTSNAGMTWTTQASGVTMNIFSIDSLDGVNAIATTDIDGSLQSAVLRTTNGGTTWTSTTLAASITSIVVQYLDATTIIIGSNGNYRRSDDSGASWTTLSGVSSTTAIAPLDSNSFIFAAGNDVIAQVRPADSFPDFASGVTDFTTATGAFGACLHTAPGAATTTWPVAGAGSCVAASPANWRGITSDSESVAANIATATLGSSATLNFRFGARPGSTQRPGLYTAKLQFEVIAP